MAMAHKVGMSFMACLFFLCSTQSIQALTLTPVVPVIPVIITAPYVVRSSPEKNERVVVASGLAQANTVPLITVDFNEEIVPTRTPASAVALENITDHVVFVGLSVVFHANSLTIQTGGLQSGKTYRATVRHDRVKSAHDGDLMSSDYTWQFKVDRARMLITGGPSEPTPSIRVEKQTLTPSVTIMSSAGTYATYRLTITNSGEYPLQNITLKDALPKGFTYDSYVSGVSYTVQGSTVLTFALDAMLKVGEQVRFDFKVHISGELSSGQPIVPAGTYNNNTIVVAEFNPTVASAASYDRNTFVSGTDDSRETDEDVLVRRQMLVLVPSSTPTATSSPTASSSPLPSPSPSVSTATPAPTPSSTVVPTPSPSASPSSSPIPHPEQDPIQCLQVDGASIMHFPDVSESHSERPYINFVNTTVYVSDPTVRLSKGYLDGNYGANNTLTRFELTKMALGSNCINYTSDPTPNAHFADVPTDDSEMSIVIGKAYQLGIVQGIGDQFYPNRAVTFGEMVKIILGAGYYFDHGTPRFQTLPSTLTGVTDESFRQFVEYSVYMNLVKPGSNNAFPQNDFVQRRFMAQAVARYVAWLKNLAII